MQVKTFFEKEAAMFRAVFTRTELACSGVILMVIAGCTFGELFVPNPPSTVEQIPAEDIAHRLITGDVSDAEVDRFAAANSTFLLGILEAGLIELKVPREQRAVYRDLLLEQQRSGRSPGECAAAAGCLQNVERENGTNGRRYAYTAVRNDWCDGTPDGDWNFNFSPAWAYNADNLRWYANSGWVRWVFAVLYGSELLGTSLCTSPVQLCIGTNGVSMAGGAGNVRQELWIWSR